MEITNIIIVRFSLKLSREWEQKAYGPAENRRPWLENRIHLMGETLVRSISIQTKRPDRVFILFDRDDENLIEEKLKLTEDKLECFFVDSGQPLRPIFNEIEDCNYKNVAISRIDSDDFIARDYLDNINKTIIHASENSESFDYIVACNGYRTDGRLVQKIFYPVAPFITSFEAEFSGLNVYSFNHEHVEKTKHIINKDAEWMQYLHGSNISNCFKGKSLSSEEYYQMIGISEDKIVAMDPIALTSELAAQFGMILT